MLSILFFISEVASPSSSSFSFSSFHLHTILFVNEVVFLFKCFFSSSSFFFSYSPRF